MTPEQAEVYAAAFYSSHPAAVPLLMETWHGETYERKHRSAVALAALNPEVSDNVVGAMGAWASAQCEADIPRPAPGPLEGAARGISDLLIHLCAEAEGRAERKRIGGLLASLCKEAAAAAARRVA